MIDQRPPVARGAPRVPPWVFDALLGMGVALIVSASIAADVEGSQPDAWAYLWAIGLGCLMVARRKYPVVVLALSAGALLSYYASGYPAIGVAVPLAAAVFSAAEGGRVAAAIITSAAMLVVSLTYRLAVGQDPALVLGFDLPAHALLLGVAIAFGDSLRSRRTLRRQASAIAELVAEGRVRELERQAVSDRLAIARELHDSVGHALTVVSLHAQIADDALDPDAHPHSDGPTARQAIQVIADTASTSFEDLRRTVANLRKEDTPIGMPLRLRDVETAILPARRAGLQVRTFVDVSSALPPPVEATAYRIVQESITNVVRHADATWVTVSVRQTDGWLDISIVNDLSAPKDPGRLDGRGIVGMRERASLVGGTCAANAEGETFVVRASLPLGEST